MVRLQWWGLYHDKPKVGTFMLRIKLPSGHRDAGEAARDRRGLERGSGAATASSPPARTSSSTGSSSASCRRSSPPRRGGHDRRRLRRHGPQHHRLPGRRASPPTSSSTPRGRRRGGEFFSATRTTRPAAQAQDHDRRLRRPCNAPEINCISLVGVVHDGREGFAVRVGGGLSSVPRIGRDLGVFVPKEEAVEVLGRDHRRLGGRPQLPRLAGQGAAQVHGRRQRPRGHARASRGAARGGRSRTSRCRRSPAEPATTWACTRRSSPASSTSASRPPRSHLRRPDDRRRRPRRAVRRRHPRHAPAELHRRQRPEAQADEVVAGWPGSASRSTSTTCADGRSPARASRTATSPSRRRRRGSAA